MRPVAVFQYRWGSRDRWRIHWNGCVGLDSAELRPEVLRFWSSGPTRASCRDDLQTAGVKIHCTCDYVMGFGQINDPGSASESAEAMTQAEARVQRHSGIPARVFKDFRYRTRHSWTCGATAFASARPSPGQRRQSPIRRHLPVSRNAWGPDRASVPSQRLLLCAGRHGEPHKRTVRFGRSVRRP